MNVLYFTLLYCCLACSINGKIDRPRGVAISKAGFYIQGAEFTCMDGSITLPFDHINDDYCDCLDGSDEPGTSACPNGSFHCTNAGHKPLNLPSSRVNDGICDCCDGTDEYESRAQCENGCKEMGKAAREEAERLSKLIKEGYEIYKEYIQLGMDARKEKEAQIDALQSKKDETDARKQELQSLKEEAEIPEKDAKEAFEKMLEEEKARREALKSNIEAKDSFGQLDTNLDLMVSVPEMQAHLEFDIDASGDVSVEEAKEYLEDKNFVDFDIFETLVWPNIKAIYKKIGGSEEENGESEDKPSDVPETEDQPRDIPAPSSSDDDGASDYDYDRDYDDDEYYDEDRPHDEDDQEDDKTNTGSDDDLPDYDENTKLLIAAADRARADFNEAETQFRNAETELKNVQTFLQLDIGPDNVFFPLKDQCYEFTDREYTYKFCPFDQATQRSKNGGSETNLGRWGHWDGPENNKYSVMKLDNGQNCWNGPNRSVRVHIKCGINNELIAASEPNRCEYEYQFLSPAACNKAIQEAMMNQDHDEL